MPSSCSSNTRDRNRPRWLQQLTTSKTSIQKIASSGCSFSVRYRGGFLTFVFWIRGSDFWRRIIELSEPTGQHERRGSPSDATLLRSAATCGHYRRDSPLSSVTRANCELERSLHPD